VFVEVPLAVGHNEAEGESDPLLPEIGGGWTPCNIADNRRDGGVGAVGAGSGEQATTTWWPLAWYISQTDKREKMEEKLGRGDKEM
jgi:hypothetical protein